MVNVEFQSDIKVTSSPKTIENVELWAPNVRVQTKNKKLCKKGSQKVLKTRGSTNKEVKTSIAKASNNHQGSLQIWVPKGKMPMKKAIKWIRKGCQNHPKWN